MKNQSLLKSVILAIFILTQFSNLLSQEAILNQLNGPFDFSNQRTPQSRRYMQETTVKTYAPDGKIEQVDIYRLNLAVRPVKEGENTFYEYTCKRFEIEKNDSTIFYIPSLTDWSYIFRNLETGIDEKGQVFGIDHAKFENITDNTGQPLGPNLSYMVYNTFIDFHGMNDGFATKTDSGGGIQDLKKIGQKIVHSAAFSDPPVNLGKHIKKGSVFKNGEITLELKGLSQIAGYPCALIGYDSGESSFNMIVQAMPEMVVTAKGSSHYFGDLYVNLETNWLQKATLHEFVVTQAVVPALPSPVNSAIERETSIELTDE